MIHANFIQTPILNIIKDAIVATSSIGDGIETYPLCHYIMQTTFLKMTGFQEQKMKCICWELACNDYEYRYEKFSKNPLGECSIIKDKNTVYKDLIDQIKKRQPQFDVKSCLKRKDLMKNLALEMERLLENTNWRVWMQREYVLYQQIIKKIECFCDTNCKDEGDKNPINRIIFPQCDNCSKKNKQTSVCQNDIIGLTSMYNKLYTFRNQCAHNTSSYRQSMPTFKTLSDKDYKYENYFLRFFILALIDAFVIELFKKYEEVSENII